MSFDTPAGTRGGRQPRAGLLMRLVNKNERARAWQQIATATPRFAKYQDKTDRELPVIRLIPQPG